MTDIKSMTQQELSQFLKELGEPAFRAKQVFTWLHRGAASFDEMTSSSLRLSTATSAGWNTRSGPHTSNPRISSMRLNPSSVWDKAT